MPSANRTPIFALLGILLLILIILYISRREDVGMKEGFAFYNSGKGAFVADETGAIRGPAVFSNHLAYGSAEDLAEGVRGDQQYADMHDFGATYQPQGIDSLIKSQNEIRRINEKNDGKVYSQSDLQAISAKMKTSASSNTNALFSRAGAKATNMEIIPGATVGVIDEDFVGERDRSQKVIVGSAAVPVKGYNLDIERLPVMMTQVTQAQFEGKSTFVPLDQNAGIANSLEGLKSMTPNVN